MLSSQKPYLIRAIYEWCLDSNYTPFIATVVDDDTQVPRQYVSKGQIILNIKPSAIKELLINHDFVTFEATFSGILNEIVIPIKNIIAIFAQENGQGMQFNLEIDPTPSPTKPKSKLTLVK